jgi:hypothetical protein
MIKTSNSVAVEKVAFLMFIDLYLPTVDEMTSIVITKMFEIVRKLFHSIQNKIGNSGLISKHDPSEKRNFYQFVLIYMYNDKKDYGSSSYRAILKSRN